MDVICGPASLLSLTAPGRMETVEQPPSEGELHLRGADTGPSAPNPQELLLSANQLVGRRARCTGGERERSAQREGQPQSLAHGGPSHAATWLATTAVTLQTLTHLTRAGTNLCLLNNLHPGHGERFHIEAAIDAPPFSVKNHSPPPQTMRKGTVYTRGSPRGPGPYVTGGGGWGKRKEVGKVQANLL